MWAQELRAAVLQAKESQAGEQRGNAYTAGIPTALVLLAHDICPSSWGNWDTQIWPITGSDFGRKTLSSFQKLNRNVHVCKVWGEDFI